MSAKHPAQVAAFLKAHARDRLTFEGEIESDDNDDNDDNEATFGWRAAADVLAGEDAFDDDKHVALGFWNDALPLVIDVSKAALPVFAMADGERRRIAGSFAAFTKKLASAEHVAKLRGERFSGLNLVPLAEHAFK